MGQDKTKYQDSIDTISSSITAIDSAVEDNAQGVTSVAEGAQILVTASEDVRDGANSIDRISSSLRDHVSGFKC